MPELPQILHNFSDEHGGFAMFHTISENLDRNMGRVREAA